MKALGILPAKREGNKEYFYADTRESECVPFRGGCFNDASGAGASALELDCSRSGIHGVVGFFTAYYDFES